MCAGVCTVQVTADRGPSTAPPRPRRAAEAHTPLYTNDQPRVISVPMGSCVRKVAGLGAAAVLDGRSPAGTRQAQPPSTRPTRAHGTTVIPIALTTLQGASVEVTPLRWCRHGSVTVRGEAAAPPAALQAFLITYHSPKDTPCTQSHKDSGRCGARVHAVPLTRLTRPRRPSGPHTTQRVSVNGSAPLGGPGVGMEERGSVVLRGVIVPDPSAGHYVIVLQVCDGRLPVCVCPRFRMHVVM